jgi:radical SAM protein with 4Fe4S-binding SPASM domain
MKSLMHEMGSRALELGIPLSVQLDLTYTCNERCVHCYLDHEDHGEMTTAEILGLLDQLAEAGVFFLTLSGGEIFMRRDFFAILERARALRFVVKLKTNAVMITAKRAARIAAIGVESVQVSIYSHRDEAHDAITKLPGSLKRTLKGVRHLLDLGVKVSFANVLMKGNEDDWREVRALCAEMGVEYKIDPTITPMMDGGREVLSLNIDRARLAALYSDRDLVGEHEQRPAPTGPLDRAEALETLPCSAGHTMAYISPYGEVFPCVQFPYRCGSVREQRFVDIWRDSPQFAEVRGISLADLEGCSSCAHGGSCSRCPGLAFTEGNLRGPSIQDCERSYALTGVASENLKRKGLGKGVAKVIWLAST